jgi:NADH-quinone oxidoreductase subunit J
MNLESILFFIFAGASIISSVMAISRRQPIFGVMYLLVLGLSVAGLFAVKKAFFLSLIQIIIYVGAVLVLFVFVIAMMNLSKEELIFGKIRRSRFLFLIPVMLIFILILSVVISESGHNIQRFQFFTAKDVSLALYKDLLFHFEYLSVFLLSAIVITVFIGMRGKKQ